MFTVLKFPFEAIHLHRLGLRSFFLVALGFAAIQDALATTSTSNPSTPTHELPRVSAPIAQVVSPLSVNGASSENLAQRNSSTRGLRRKAFDTQNEGPKKLQVMVYTSTHMDPQTTERLISELKRFKAVIEPAVLLAGMPVTKNKDGLEVINPQVFNTFLSPFLNEKIPVAIDPTAFRLMWAELTANHTGDLAVARAPRLPIVKLTGFGESALVVQGSASLVEAMSVFVNQRDTNREITTKLAPLIEALENDPRFADLMMCAKAAGIE